VDAFIALVQYSYHTLVPGYKSASVHVAMIRTPHPQATITTNEVMLMDGDTHFASVVLARNHLAVLVYELQEMLDNYHMDTSGVSLCHDRQTAVPRQTARRLQHQPRQLM
jgi:hypothetical protein